MAGELVERLTNERRTSKRRTNDERMTNKRQTNDEQTTNKRRTNDEEFAQLSACRNRSIIDSSASDAPTANELIVASAHSSNTTIDRPLLAEEEGSV